MQEIYISEYSYHPSIPRTKLQDGPERRSLFSDGSTGPVLCYGLFMIMGLIRRDLPWVSFLGKMNMHMCTNKETLAKVSEKSVNFGP